MSGVTGATSKPVDATSRSPSGDRHGVSPGPAARRLPRRARRWR